MKTKAKRLPDRPAIKAKDRIGDERHQKHMARIELHRSGFYGRSNLRGITAISVDYIVVISAILLTIFFGWFLYPISAVIIASRYRGIENLVHEASHYNLFATRPWNDSLDTLFSFSVFRCVKDYRNSHVDDHHGDLGGITDPDMKRYIRLGVVSLPKRKWWILVIRPLTFYHHIEYLKTTFAEFWKSRTKRTSKIAFWFSTLAVVALTNWWIPFLLFWIIPLFLLLPIMRFWAEIPKHAGTDMNNEFGSARNNLGFIHRFILHPHNDGFHAVHHFAPAVPWYMLPGAYRVLMQYSYFADNLVESHSFRETLRQMNKPLILPRTSSNDSSYATKEPQS